MVTQVPEVLLRGLDPDNDDHWTSDRLPRVDVVSELVGQATTREEITNAAPGLNRDTMRTLSAAGKPGGDSEDSSPGDSSAPEETKVVAPPSEPKEAPRPSWLNVDTETEVSDDEEDVLTMPYNDVANDYDLLCKAQARLGDVYQEKASAREQLDREMKIISGKQKTIERLIELHKRQRPKEEDTGIRDYLKRNNESRKKRAEAAKRFVDQGTTQEDVRKQLASKSPLDQAMQQRKPARGSERPAAIPPR